MANFLSFTVQLVHNHLVSKYKLRFLGTGNEKILKPDEEDDNVGSEDLPENFLGDHITYHLRYKRDGEAYNLHAVLSGNRINITFQRGEKDHDATSHSFDINKLDFDALQRELIDPVVHMNMIDAFFRGTSKRSNRWGLYGIAGGIWYYVVGDNSKKNN